MIKTILRRLTIFPLVLIGVPTLYFIGILMTDKDETKYFIYKMLNEAWNGLN